MKCEVCKEECDGKLIVRKYEIEDPVVCCPTCFELWTNQEYGKLRKRIKRKDGK